MSMMSQILPLNAVSQILAVSTDHLNEGGGFYCLLSMFRAGYETERGVLCTVQES